MFLFPGHKYLGPGNSVNNGEPIDSDDEIAYEHDKAYETAKTKEDIYEADRVAISSFGKSALKGNWHSAIGFAGLGLKHLTEKASGKILYPSMSDSDNGKGKGKRVNIISDLERTPTGREWKPKRPRIIEYISPEKAERQNRLLSNIRCNNKLVLSPLDSTARYNKECVLFSN